MNNNPFNVSVVIPNYNGEHIILKTLEQAIQALETSTLVNSYEIIVSDDASIDRSISLIEQNFREVKIIHSKTNSGFSGNVNRGVDAAKHEFVLILNSDLHLEKGYFDSIVPMLEDRNVFGVMGSIRDPKTHDYQDGAKLPIVNLKMFISSNKNEFSNSAVIPTFFLSGANALIRRDYFLQLGGFCELFNPYYAEDVDLGIRAWRAGWELYFQPKSVCYHEVSATIKNVPEEKVSIIAKRNRYILHALHLPLFFLVLFDLNLVFVTLFRTIKGDYIYWQAFKQYIILKKSIRIARIEFINQNKSQKTLSLFEVIEKIKSMKRHPFLS